MVRFTPEVYRNGADQAQQQQQNQQLSATTTTSSSSSPLQACRLALKKQHALSAAECAGACGAAGQAQQQQQDAQAALQSYERAAALGRQALRSAAGPASSSGSLKRGAEGQAASAPVEAMAGNGERARGNGGLQAAADGVHIQEPDPDPDPGGALGRNPRPAGRAPALQVAVRALLAQAALLRAQGLRVAAEAAEDEALVLDPFAQNGMFELLRARAAGGAGVKRSRGVKAPAAVVGA